MAKLKLKINVKILQLLCVVVSVQRTTFKHSYRRANSFARCHSKQFLYKQNLRNLILFTCLLSLQPLETVSSIDESRKPVSKRALITSWIQNSPFHYENFTYQHNLRCFYTDKVTCNTNKATRSKTKKLTWDPEALSLYGSCNTSRPHSNFFSGCESIHFWSEKFFSTKRLRFVACWFSFTLSWNYGRCRLNSEAMRF